jgi:hypothetical protein
MTTQQTPSEAKSPRLPDDAELGSVVSYSRMTAIWTIVSAVFGLLGFCYGVFGLLMTPFLTQYIPKGMKSTGYIFFIQIVVVIGKATFNVLLLYLSIQILKSRFDNCNRLTLAWFCTLGFELLAIVWGFIYGIAMNKANLANQPQISGSFPMESFMNVVWVLSIIFWIFWFIVADAVPAFLSWRLQRKYLALSKKHPNPDEAIRNYLDPPSPESNSAAVEGPAKKEDDGWQ